MGSTVGVTSGKREVTHWISWIWESFESTVTRGERRNGARPGRSDLHLRALRGQARSWEKAMIHLRHVALRCRDMELSRRFYERLGLRFIDYRPARNALDLSDGMLNLTLIQHDGSERPVLEEG